MEADGYAERVVAEREKEILPDVLHGGAKQGARANDSEQVALHQRDTRTLHGDIGTRSHGNTHMRLSQCRSVIDTIAHHGYAPRFLPDPREHTLLFFRQQPGINRNPKSLLNRARFFASIAGKDCETDARVFELGDGRFRAFSSQRVEPFSLAATQN